jgi:hypothetical protein
LTAITGAAENAGMLRVGQRNRRGINYLAEIGDSKDEANGIQDIALAGTIEARDGIELRIEARHHSTLRIALKALDHNLLDIHSWISVWVKAKT